MTEELRAVALYLRAQRERKRRVNDEQGDSLLAMYVCDLATLLFTDPEDRAAWHEIARPRNV